MFINVPLATRANVLPLKVCLVPKFASMVDFEDRMADGAEVWVLRTAANRGL